MARQKKEDKPVAFYRVSKEESSVGIKIGCRTSPGLGWIVRGLSLTVPEDKVLKESVYKPFTKGIMDIIGRKVTNADLHGVLRLDQGVMHKKMSTLLKAAGFSKILESDPAFAVELCGGSDYLFKKRVILIL